jgi:hypothetical protein
MIQLVGAGEQREVSTEAGFGGGFFWTTHICRVDHEWPDIRAGESSDSTLILGGVAYDENNEPTSFHVQSKRLGQWKRGQPRDDDNIGASTVPCPLRPTDFSERLVCQVSFVDTIAASDDYEAGEDFVPCYPILKSFKSR